MARDVDDLARLLVTEGARGRCEYCLVHENNAGFPHQIDHIINREHGGSSGIGNLAYACILCNRYKGADIALNRSLRSSGPAVRSRRDSWDEHFKLDGPIIQPFTAIGEVTAHPLRLNAAEQVIERRLFQAFGSHRKL